MIMRLRPLYHRVRSGLLVVALASLPLVPLKLSPYLAPPRKVVAQPISTVDAPDAEFEPVFTQTITPPVDIAELVGIETVDDLVTLFPAYERVDCGDIDDDVCYEICASGRCYIFGDNDGRVTRFKEMVDNVEELEDKLELLRQEQTAAIIDAAGTCLKAGAAAAAVKVALVALAAPDVTWSKVVAVLAFAGAGLFCIGSVYSAWRIEATKQEQVRENIDEAYNDALFEFSSLEASPP